MKTIKTINGIKRIEDWDVNLVPIQLRPILQEHRATLIDKLLTGGMESYVHYKFNIKVKHPQTEAIKLKLTELRNAGIDVETYKPVFETVMNHSATILDNALFYAEIDKVIEQVLSQPPLFTGRRQLFFQ